MTDEEIHKLRSQIANEIYTGHILSHKKVDKKFCKYLASKIINKVLIKKKRWKKEES
jgi:hypothetical protein